MIFKFTSNLFIRLSIVVVALSLQACIDVESPPVSHFVAGDLELTVVPPEEKARSKNLILVAVDEKFQDLVKGGMSKERMPKRYHELLQNYRMEELGWWAAYPKLKKTYNKIVRIRPNGFDMNSLKQAIEVMEAQDEPYDLFLFVHGIPYYLAPSSGREPIDTVAVEELKGRTTKLDTVFLQGCYGDTFAQPWINAGANQVIYFEDLNINFFFGYYYIDEQKTQPARIAYEKTVQEYRSRIKSHFRKDGYLARRLITILAKQLKTGESVDQYLDKMQPPKILRKEDL